MYTESQTLKLKADQKQEGLPAEVTITRIEGEVITVSSSDGVFETSAQILDAFYTSKENLTLENLPKVTMATIDEALTLFDVYASTHDPLTGIQVKSKLFNLKAGIAKVTGQVVEASAASPLGRKIS